MPDGNDEYLALAGSVLNSIWESRNRSNTDFASLDSRRQRPLLDPELRPAHLVRKRTTQPRPLCFVVFGDSSQLLRGFAEDANTRHFS